MRIEKLESEVAALRDDMKNGRHNVTLFDPNLTLMAPHHLRERSNASTAVNVGLVTWDQAVLWFQR